MSPKTILQFGLLFSISCIHSSLSRELRFLNPNGHHGLTPSERQLLEDILEADDLIMTRIGRGVADRVLMTINTISKGVLGVVGNFAQAGNGVTQSATGTGVATNVNEVATPAPASAMPSSNGGIIDQINRLLAWERGGELPPGTGGGSGSSVGSSGGSGSGGRNNITMIVDQALMIGTPGPVRDLVNGILGVAYCSGARRVLGRC